MNLGPDFGSAFQTEGFHLYSFIINNKIEELAIECALNSFTGKQVTMPCEKPV